ncbi:MAG: hypothetical protein K6U89_06690 [Chloroflexi bacterium]|nr:hypothetical protein [Chloroflexota bacterium]
MSGQLPPPADLPPPRGASDTEPSPAPEATSPLTLPVRDAGQEEPTAPAAVVSGERVARDPAAPEAALPEVTTLREPTVPLPPPPATTEPLTNEPAWSFFEAAPPPPPLPEPPYLLNDRWVVDETGELLEVARDGRFSRWWNSLAQYDRRFYFGALLLFLASSFLYCLGATALVLTPALQPAAVVFAATGTPTSTPTPFIVGLTPQPTEPLMPTPTFGVPPFFLVTATPTPRLLPEEPEPTASPLPRATSTPLLPVLATATPLSAGNGSGLTPTVPPANATFTPVPTRPVASPSPATAPPALAFASPTPTVTAPAFPAASPTLPRATPTGALPSRSPTAGIPTPTTTTIVPAPPRP